MPVSNASWLFAPKKENKKKKSKWWNSAWRLVDLEVSTLHKGWAKPTVIRSRVGSKLFTLWWSISIPSMTVGRVRVKKKEGWGVQGHRGTRTCYCWWQPLCHGCSHPTGTSRLRRRAEKDSRTCHTNCCLLHRSGRDTAQCIAWTTHSNSANFSWSTIETGAWQGDRGPTRSHSTGRLNVTPVVMFVVVVVVALAPVVVVRVLVSPPPLLYRVYSMLTPSSKMSPTSFFIRGGRHVKVYSTSFWHCKMIKQPRQPRSFMFTNSITPYVVIVAVIDIIVTLSTAWCHLFHQAVLRLTEFLFYFRRSHMFDSKCPETEKRFFTNVFYMWT